MKGLVMLNSRLPEIEDEIEAEIDDYLTCEGLPFTFENRCSALMRHVENQELDETDPGVKDIVETSALGLFLKWAASLA